MHNDRTEKNISDLRAFCLRQGFPEERFLSLDNLDKYVETSVDAYKTYPLHLLVFEGSVDTGILTRMHRIDFKSRMNKTLGIATEDYQSVLIVEPPMAEKTGVLQYLRVIDRHSLKLLLSHETLEMEHFEDYALKKREPFQDDKTWYIYVFATKQAAQRQGHGKKLMHLIRLFADENGYQLCLETNKTENVPMYEKFGFRLVSSNVFHGNLDHYVMLYPGG